MSWFEVICHAFSGLSRGESSTHDASIGCFDSEPIEIVLTILQIIAAVNFATHYMAWRSKDLTACVNDAEARCVVGVVGLLAVSCIGIGTPVSRTSKVGLAPWR